MGLELTGEVAFWAFLGLSALSAATAAAPLPPGGGKAVGALALAAGLALNGAICLLAGRPPMSGAFESLSLMALVLAGLALYSLFGRNSSPRLAALAWGGVVLLLAILIWMPRQVNPDWFVYQFFWTRAFFVLRCLAMAVLFYSALAALACYGPEPEGAVRRGLISRSRRFLLAGTALFLVGEVCGFYWCLNWRGDYWLWNRNFLESTMIFLLASAALHLPPKLAARPTALRLAYSLPGFLAMGAFLVHQITG